MKAADVPAFFSMPFANQAAVGYIRSIPPTPSGTPGQASLTTGFPSENFNPVSAGGVPPFGQDFNGIFHQATSWNQWSSVGAPLYYNSGVSSDIGGYPSGTVLSAAGNLGFFWLCLVDDNTTNPDTGGANWLGFAACTRPSLTQNTTLYVNTAIGSDTLYNGLSPTVSGSNGPFKTIGKAISTTFNYGPSVFTMTIQIADGTYNEGVSTPQIGGPAIIINGNASARANVVINAASGYAVNVMGPNSVTVSNLKGISTDVRAAVFAATTSGASLTTINTENGVSASYVFLATGGGSALLNSHTFSGNSNFGFAAYRNGSLLLNASAVYTISTPITMNAFSIVVSSGSIEVSSTSPPTFVNSGNVTGSRYTATLNGTINTQGQTTSYFPGSTAGTLATGGQYA